MIRMTQKQNLILKNCLYQNQNKIIPKIKPNKLYWLTRNTHLLLLYLSWIACCGEFTAAQCDSLKCRIRSVNLWIWIFVWCSRLAVQMGKLKLRRANAIAAADIIDGVYCKYGSASNNDNSLKYCNEIIQGFIGLCTNKWSLLDSPNSNFLIKIVWI